MVFALALTFTTEIFAKEIQQPNPGCPHFFARLGGQARKLVSRFLGKKDNGNFLELKTDWDAAKWGIKNFGERWIDRLPMPERQALEEYKTHRFEAINNLLRGRAGDIEQSARNRIISTIKNIDRAALRAKVEENMLVFRGDKGLADNDLNDIWSGKVKTYAPKTYVSTSLTKGYAKEFAGKGYLLEIELPKGARGAPLDINPEWAAVKDWNGFQEREFLLPRNSQFEVVGRSRKSGSRVIRLRLVLPSEIK